METRLMEKLHKHFLTYIENGFKITEAEKKKINSLIVSDINVLSGQSFETVHMEHGVLVINPVSKKEVIIDIAFPVSLLFDEDNLVLAKNRAKEAKKGNRLFFKMDFNVAPHPHFDDNGIVDGFIEFSSTQSNRLRDWVSEETSPYLFYAIKIGNHFPYSRLLPEEVAVFENHTEYVPFLSKIIESIS
jgi:hypothetical protein